MWWYKLVCDIKLIQRNVKKAGKEIVETHGKVINLSEYRLNTKEIDLLKNGLNVSIPPKFIRKIDAFCQFDMIAKFWTTDVEENEV